VREAFDAEERDYFEAAKESRRKARDYLVDLPRGPHADAAVALLLGFDATVDSVETARLLRDAHRSEALLERASAQRRAVGEHLLARLVVLLDPSIYGVSFDAAPPALHRVIDGPARRTWGQVPARRTEELFFSIPTVRERESRLAVVTIEIVSAGSVVVEGRISGPSLFLRWLEADEMRARDEGDASAERDAISHAVDVLGGALEARMPKARCDAVLSTGQANSPVFVRSCDGFTVTASVGKSDGSGNDAQDVIVVRRSSS
jgi:hypothetical protein